MDATGSVLATLLAALLATLAAVWALRRRRKLQLFRRLGISGPRPSLLAGNLLQLHEVHPNVALSAWIGEYGGVFGFYMGEAPYLVVSDLDLLKQVLIKDFHLFTDRPILFFDFDPADKTMVMQRGARWKEIRSILTPSFSSGKIKLMSGIVNQKVDITIDLLTKKVDSGEMFDIYDISQRLTLDVIADCALAMKTRSQEHQKNVLLDAARVFFEDFQSSPMVRLAVMFPVVAALGKVLFRFLRARRMLQTILGNVDSAIQERMRNPKARSADFLQLVLDSRQNESKEMTPMSDTEIAANAAMFLFGGYETTSTSMAFTFYLLALHPEVQERLYREIEEAEDSSYNSVQSLQYLDQVCNESLRLYPPVILFISRVLSEDFRVGDISVPKGTAVLSPVWNIHHDPDLWPDPFRFDPDRFAPENKAGIRGLAFQPFGAGPRSCIGSRFALLEVKLAIFRLLKRFRFEACERTERPVQLNNVPLTLQPKNGVWLRAVRRPEAN